MILDRDKINDRGVPLEHYHFFDFFLFSGYFLPFFLNTFDQFVAIYNFLRIYLGFLYSILLFAFLLILPEIFQITNVLVQKIYYKFFSNKIQIKGRNSTSKISLMQIGPIYLLLYIHATNLSLLIMDFITLAIIFYPLIRGSKQFMVLTKNLFDTSEKTYLNAITSEESMWFVNFISLFGFILGVNPIIFFLLIYIRYPIRYFFFERKKYQDFYENLEYYGQKFLVIIFGISIGVGFIPSTIFAVINNPFLPF